MKFYLDQIKADPDPQRQSRIVGLMLDQANIHTFDARVKVGIMEADIYLYTRQMSPDPSDKERHKAHNLQAGMHLDVASFYLKNAQKLSRAMNGQTT